MIHDPSNSFLIPEGLLPIGEDDVELYVDPQVYADVVKDLSHPPDPFRVIESGYLWIRIRGGLLQFIPANFFPAQKLVYEKAKDCYRRGIPIRFRILKARQMGISTLLQGLLYSFAVEHHYFNALVLSFRTKSARWLFNMDKLFQEQIEKRGEYRVPKLVQDNRIAMEWKDTHSIISIDTEGSEKVALTETRDGAILTEYAFYRNPVILCDDLYPSIPDEPGTMIFIETTANGTGDIFHQEWLKGEKKRDMFENIFFPWHCHPKYRVEVPKGQKVELAPEERALKERFKLDDGQVLWRRKMIEEKFRGDVEAFNEKYPDSPETAFRAPGGIVMGSIRKTLNDLLPILRPGRVGVVSDTGTGRLGFTDDQFGKIEVFQDPVPGERYAMGTDVAEGLTEDQVAIPANEDEDDEDDRRRREKRYREKYKSMSTCIVRKFSTWELCAIMECQWEEEIFAFRAADLGFWYNTALWGIELPGPGRAVVAYVKDLYPNLYRFEEPDEDNEHRTAKRYGYRNTERTRGILEAGWREFVREETDLENLVDSKVGSSRLVGQALTYIEDRKTGKHRPKLGCFSDMLFADMICIQLLKTQPPEEGYDLEAERFLAQQEERRQLRKQRRRR